MKKILSALFFLALISCTKETPQIKCGFITAKNGGYFYMGEGEGMIKVSDSVYNAHEVGDYYCYQ